jgi:osmotically-inducible protein OsmY
MAFKVFHKFVLCSTWVALLLISSGSSIKLAYSNSQGPEEVSADNQGNSKVDVEITKAIRQSLMRDKNLSADAHNVKIITQGKKVTLKGPVKSEKEKMIITQKAKSVVGSKNVTDQLEVMQPS